MSTSPSGFACAPAAARATVHHLRASRIREVANAGIGLPDVLPFWFGESDQVTPAFIRDAASRALAGGATFYTHNLGIARCAARWPTTSARCTAPPPWTTWW